jgi:phosphinothricin acetyltransferase
MPSGMRPLIRDSLPGDIPAITAIYAHAVLHGNASFELDPPDAVEIARRRDALLAGGYPYLVAEQHGVVVGYAAAGVYRPRPGYRFTVENSVYVAPDHKVAALDAPCCPG